MRKYVLAIDQGTTSSRAIIFNDLSQIVSISQQEFKQYYSEPSWVLQDPEEIYDSVIKVIFDAVAKANLKLSDISAIGITNQRETVVMWDKETAKPIYKAICWQSRQSEYICRWLKNNHYEPVFRKKTGLVLDPYFSGTKIKWILDNIEGARELAKQERLLCGTIDTWLIWRLTEGKVHATDYSNASRTLIFNIYDLCFDDELLQILDIPKSILPKVYPSSYHYGYATALGENIPITGVAGDQQAALFGQTCFNEGEVKNTYGTGCFMLMNTGDKIVHSSSGLLTTIAWGINDKVSYALEGSIFVAGSAVTWLRDQIQLFEKSSQTEEMATSVKDNGGVYFVPALVGLGTPHWDSEVRGAFLGLSHNTTKNHLTRAVLEAICYQTKEVLDVMTLDSKIPIKSLRVDGGASQNNLLLQFQSDILRIEVIRPQVIESTALGAAYLAGLNVGVWDSFSDICQKHNIDKIFTPKMDQHESAKLLNNYKKAVACTKMFKID